jgi:poly(hydroxyalkanoate) depolymerase family esterase
MSKLEEEGQWLRGLLAQKERSQAASVVEKGTGEFLSGTFSNSAGVRPYKLYIPAGYSPATPAPLLVALHGCTQDPDNFATGTRFNMLADRHTFLVLYPQQTRAHQPRKCWGWYSPVNQKRGSGEPAILAGLIDDVLSRYTLDENRIFITGMSAGAAMAVIMGACYPDYFAAVGVHSGLEFRAAHDLISAASAQIRGGPDPDAQGELAYLSAGEAARVMPVIVFQGNKDYRVYPINSDQVIQQFARANDYADDGLANNSISSVPNHLQTVLVPGGYSYTIYTYKHRDRVLMQMYNIDDLGHAWSGGSSTPPATYTDPKGPDASSIMWDFFTAHPKATDTLTPPPPAHIEGIVRRWIPSLKGLFAHRRKKRPWIP